MIPAVTLLIKPASGACDHRCKYCFYSDVAGHRQEAFRGTMSLETSVGGKMPSLPAELKAEGDVWMYHIVRKLAEDAAD